jgi:protease I
MSLKGRTAVVLVDQMYQEMEVWYPLYRLREEGLTVVTVGVERGKSYPSKLGYPCIADKTIQDIPADKVDCLIIPGGYAPDHLRRHDSINQYVADIMKRDVITGAICHAGWMLCSADALRGRKVTSFIAIKADMVHAGAEWVDAEVVRDRNLITSRKPDDLPAFMVSIVAALKEQFGA